MVRDRPCLDDSEGKDASINEYIDYQGVYRTAAATPNC